MFRAVCCNKGVTEFKAISHMFSKDREFKLGTSISVPFKYKPGQEISMNRMLNMLEDQHAN